MIDAETYRSYATDPAVFRNDLLVDVDGKVVRFASVMDDWQRADFQALDPGFMRCNGQSDRPAVMRAYLERGRGHSKTCDTSIMVCWALAFATRLVRGYCFASDRDQARLLRNAIELLIRLNPWLGLILEVQRDAVRNIAANHPGSGSTLQIEDSTVGGSFGILPDFIAIDEITHWAGDDSLWHSLISSSAKRSTCMLTVIANAGYSESWQWGVREQARTDDAWYFSRLDGPVASWLTPDRLAEQERMLPQAVYRRLWGNEWADGSGDGLSAVDIDAATILPPEHPLIYQPNADEIVVGGIDLAVRRDHAALAIVAVNVVEHLVKLVLTVSWRPQDFADNEIDLQTIEHSIIEATRRYRVVGWLADPWQAMHLIQRLTRQGIAIGEFTFAGENLDSMAQSMMTAFRDRRLQLYPDERLRRDLGRIRITESNYGRLRLSAIRDSEGGHCDRAIALAIILPEALQASQELMPGFAECRDEVLVP